MADSWKITQASFDLRANAQQESIFSLGNGFLGLRGFFVEREPAYHPGVFVNGFYESTPITYGERAYGFAEFNQTMLDVPDCRFIEIYSGEYKFSMQSGVLHSFNRELDLKNGTLTRRVEWESPNGDHLSIVWEHLVSYRYKNIGGMRIRIEQQGTHPITIHSGIAVADSRPENTDDPRVGGSHAISPLVQISQIREKREKFLSVQTLFHTKNSGLSLLCGNALSVISGQECESMPEDQSENSFYCISSPASVNESSTIIEIEKLYFYCTAKKEDEDRLYSEYRINLESGINLGYSGLADLQREELKTFWNSSDVIIKGDPEFQKTLRFNIFQLYQSTGKDGYTSLSSKGLTGCGYEGHYFWDTEIYAMPFFTSTSPEIARSLLKYRISILDHARKRAAELTEEGALYPWRTINGIEASAFFPAGTAQYHINADIIFSLIQYIEITGDETLLFEGGAEMLFETARLWLSLGFYNSRKSGKFCINEVTGPDEYSALVNNNFYTNSMAANHLKKAASWFYKLKKNSPEFFRQLSLDIFLMDSEAVEWHRASELMYIPYDTKLGIHPQDDAFLERERWDLAATPNSSFPLLLHYHPLVIYRHQVIKQADTILALLLLHDQYSFSQKRRDFDYYEPLTTGDSSLSACIQGIIALELGYCDIGKNYARSTAFVDIDDLQGNTSEGLHTASMAGSWMLVVYGFAGLRYREGVPWIYPHYLPENWEKLEFSLKTSSGLLFVRINSEWTEYICKETCLEASRKSIEVVHRNKKLMVGDEPLRVKTGPEFKGAVFDLDGVITSTDDYHYLAWKYLANEMGWVFTREINHRLRGVSRSESLLIIAGENNILLTETEIQAMTEKKNKRYLELLDDLSDRDIMPGTIELLSQLRKRGVKTALASASRNAGYIIDKLGLSDHFGYIVSASSVEFGKPDPEIFIKASEGIGLLPDECVGFEDAQPGIEGINAAGMKSVGVGESVSGSNCDLHIADLSDITASDLEKLFVFRDVKG
ncbi:MAG: beta-phosphoglucomutase [Bacteroidetes bacterium]|nr:beta-phosphoglucomutase [Bacteroidota bacterium]